MSDPNDQPDRIPAAKDLQIGAQLLLLLMAAAVIFLGVMGSRWFFAKRKKHERKPRGEREVLVELETLAPTDKQLQLHLAGTVVPARQTSLRAQVGGVVTAVHPHLDDGHRVAAGSVLVELERRDYELAVQMRQAELEQRRAEYQLELGQQAVAKSELAAATRDGGELSPQEESWITRQPQLKRVQAAVSAAEAALAQARLNLDRTRIKAPFDAVVRARHVDVGTRISAGAAIAELVGTAEFWVEATVPQDELRWIRFPDGDGAGGAHAVIRSAAGIQAEAAWTGEVLRLLPALEGSGRMARVLIRIRDPLTRQDGLPLLLGSYVNVRITGRRLQEVFVLDRTALHNGDQVWLRNVQNRLEARTVDVLWRGPEIGRAHV